tara:strand:- start:1221 stop:2324 length:1104 start_codon:yes stop_codon:yes gene_type:complete
MKTKLFVKTNSKKYPIYIGNNLLKNIQSILNLYDIKFDNCLIVADKKVPKKNLSILKSKIKSRNTIIYLFVSNEKNKNLKSVNIILEKLFKNNFKRNDIIISLGGGITGDVTGYAASIFKRGLKFVNIPTTLLAQVDSAIGGKTGVNNKYGKNLIGSFYQPDCVVTDTNLLKSLPKREIICGYGEILKHTIIANKNKFKFLDKNKFKILNLKTPYIEKAILDSCIIKKNIVQKDEKEKNLRKILNLGHTFAHSFEATLGYSKELNHGEAVILGIKTAAKFSFENKILSKKNYNTIESHINDLNINSKFKSILKKKNLKKILNFMKSDKKNNSTKINLILLKNIGKPLIHLNFRIDKIKKFLSKELIY